MRVSSREVGRVGGGGARVVSGGGGERRVFSEVEGHVSFREVAGTSGGWQR